MPAGAASQVEHCGASRKLDALDQGVDEPRGFLVASVGVQPVIVC